MAVRGEEWITSLYPKIKSKLDQALVQPAFIHCAGQCDTVESGSRYNPTQAKLAVNLLCELMKVPGGEDHAKCISVISPYNAMNDFIRGLLDEANLGDKTKVQTTDTFEGQETAFVFYVLTVNSSSGPGHVASRHRSNVGIARHTDGLFVIGDIRTVDTADKKKKKMAVVNEEGETEYVEVRGLGEMLDCFETEVRCSNIPVDPALEFEPPLEFDNGNGNDGWNNNAGGRGNGDVAATTGLSHYLNRFQWDNRLGR